LRSCLALQEIRIFIKGQIGMVAQGLVQDWNGLFYTIQGIEGSGEALIVIDARPITFDAVEAMASDFGKIPQSQIDVAKVPVHIQVL